MKRVLLILSLFLAAWLVWEWVRFPDVARLAKERPATTAFIERRKEVLRSEGKSDRIEWTWVSYGRISPNLRRAVLVAEDGSFYEHEGVDVQAMREAFERNWKSGKLAYGGSTITQQLAKNLYLSPSRNPLRKVREFFIARALEEKLSKKRILELYLNVVELGERVYGAEAASRHYFGKPASSLTPREAALLAGALPNPRVLDPAKPNKRLRARQNMIVSRMKRWGYLLEREVLTERKPKPKAAAPEPDPGIEPPVTDTDLAPQDETPSTDTAPATDTTASSVPLEEPSAEPPPDQSTVVPEPPPTVTTT